MSPTAATRTRWTTGLPRRLAGARPDRLQPLLRVRPGALQSRELGQVAVVRLRFLHHGQELTLAAPGGVGRDEEQPGQLALLPPEREVDGRRRRQARLVGLGLEGGERFRLARQVGRLHRDVGLGPGPAPHVGPVEAQHEDRLMARLGVHALAPETLAPLVTDTLLQLLIERDAATLEVAEGFQRGHALHGSGLYPYGWGALTLRGPAGRVGRR